MLTLVEGRESKDVTYNAPDNLAGRPAHERRNGPDPSHEWTMAEAGDKGIPLKDYIKVHEQPEPLVRAKLDRGCRADTGQACVMTGPEAIDWVARIAREIEPIQRSWQRFTRDIEQATKLFAGEWRQLFEAWQQLSRAFVAARDRSDFRDFQFRLQLTVWMGQQIKMQKVTRRTEERARGSWCST